MVCSGNKKAVTLPEEKKIYDLVKVKNIAHVFSIVYNIFVVTNWTNRGHVGGNHENAR